MSLGSENKADTSVAINPSDTLTNEAKRARTNTAVVVYHPTLINLLYNWIYTENNPAKATLTLGRGQFRPLGVVIGEASRLC